MLVSGTDGVGHKTEARLPDGQARHHRRRLRRHVRQRRCMHGRAAAVLPGLYCMRKECAGENRTDRQGVADGCVQAGCALIGGETAEMPGFMRRTNTTWPGFPWALWTAKDNRRHGCLSRRRHHRPGLIRGAFKRFLPWSARSLESTIRTFWPPITNSSVPHWALPCLLRR